MTVVQYVSNELTSKRIRPGMYAVTTSHNDTYNVIENEFSGQWLWAVIPVSPWAVDLDLGLFSTKRAAMAALKEATK
jgi:hypothetical protein